MSKKEWFLAIVVGVVAITLLYAGFDIASGRLMADVKEVIARPSTEPDVKKVEQESATLKIIGFNNAGSDLNLINPTAYDIIFCGDNGTDIEFRWRDGKFDVVYDANKCTQSAQTFIECVLPYLNDAIEEKAKELIERKNNL